LVLQLPTPPPPPLLLLLLLLLFCSVELPELPLGVLHVALLPTSVDSSSSSRYSSNSVSISKSSSSSLLLLTPLLVLPAAAADDLQQHWQQAAAAAAAEQYENGNADSAADAHSLSAVWDGCIAPLTTDIAYVLSACKDANSWQTTTQAAATAAAAAGESGVQLPEGVRAVLQQLLTHLAAYGMWAVMQLLVQCATEAAAAATAAASSTYSAAVVAASAGAKGAEVMEDVTSQCSSSEVTPDSPTASSSSSSSGDSTAKLLDTSSCSRSSSGPLKPAVAAAAAAAEQQVTSRQFADLLVPAKSLLWGFENRQLEDSYQAAAYSSSGAMDVATLMYAAAVGISCYYGRNSSSSSSSSSILQPELFLRSQLVAVLVCVVGPIAVLVHRWCVGRQLQAIRQQHQHHQQQGNHASPRRCRTSLELRAAAAAASTASSSSSGSAAAEQAQRILIAAAGTKHRVLQCWMVLVMCWGFVILAGGCGVILEPFIVTKQWRQVGWAANVGAMVGWSLKGWTTQVSCCR
jgi:hypothetical protein